MISADPFLETLAAMEAEFPGYHVENVHTGMSWGSRDRNGTYKPDVGSFRQWYPGHWYVTITQEGWEGESDRFIDGADTPALAVEAIVAHLRERRDNPHVAHIEDHNLLSECEACLEDADRLDIPRVELPMVLG
jgi:hypothetical protein